MKFLICLGVLAVLAALTMVSCYLAFNVKYGHPIHHGNILLDKGDWQGALANYDVAIQENKSNYWAFCRRGEAYDRLEKTLQSLDDYGEGIRLIIDVKKSWLRYGHWLIDTHSSIEYECYFNRGILLADTGKIKEAKSDFDAAIDAVSTANAHYLRGKVLQALGDYENALRDANKSRANGRQRSGVSEFATRFAEQIRTVTLLSTLCRAAWSRTIGTRGLCTTGGCVYNVSEIAEHQLHPPCPGRSGSKHGGIVRRARRRSICLGRQDRLREHPKAGG